MKNAVALEASNLNFSYRKPVVRNFSLSLQHGVMTGIIGPNGSGKTTVLRLLAGLLAPSTGDVRLWGSTPLNRLGRKEIARHIAMVPQSSIGDSYHTVYQFTLMGRSPHFSLLGFESKKDEQVAQEALERTHLVHLKGARASELSGGEMQRLLLARALAQQTEILMLDELTANLDIRFQVELMRMASHLTKEKGLATLVVSHEINLLAAFCDQVVLMAEGAILTRGPVGEVISGENLKELFGLDFSVHPGASGTREVLPYFKDKDPA